MSDKRHRDEIQDVAVAGTFPASDPPASMAEGGARAVPPERMMEGATPRPAADSVELHRSFPDAEAAKLALEGLVRDGPLDRRCTTIRQEGGRAELRIQAPREDAERLRRLLDHA